jgi:site-specific DNA-methyltransferase (adenine-specific)
MTKALAEIDRGELLLAKAQSAEEAAQVAHAADALAKYLKKVKAGAVHQNRAAALATKARRKVGEFVGNNPEGRPPKKRTLECTFSSVAREAGVSKALVQQWHSLADAYSDADIDAAAAKATEAQPPEEFTTSLLLTELKERATQTKKADREKELVAKVASMELAGFEEACEIRHCSMRDLLASGIRPDAIITDPPYPKEYIPLYGEMAELAKHVPLVAVMSPHAYLPEIFECMCKHLKYCWTIAWLMPGGIGASQWQVKATVYWKPILLFGEVPKWFADVSSSDVNAIDKRFHDWGQSESGMADLIDRLTEPGQLICDPFLGAGTTGVAAIKLKRRFIGCDIDASACETAMLRCKEAWA